ncbi:ubiquitin-like protein 7 [Ylistrum balloti]|uniref:ubiquitin-like protein 7 n=1 Tax=Ylistrum balloti TaxID=509963 RepID=UPI002905B92E|nr:ubiquitin-like protein 7 [Ylistrum balloti]
MGTGSSLDTHRPKTAAMASVSVCNRTIHGKSERMKLNLMNLKGKVSIMKNEISRIINLPSQDFDLVYCGQRLDDDKQMEQYGLKNGSTVFALKRHIQYSVNDAEQMSPVAVKNLVATLRSALLNPAYRTTVERILNEPDAMENVIAATPGLDKDPVALAMLQDQELLAILAHPDNIQKIVEKHPSFGQAATLIAAEVSKEGRLEDSDHTATGTYSLDQMSDDEDMPNNRPEPSMIGGQAITASQLSAALAAATGSPSQPPPNQAIPPPAYNSAQRPAGSSGITQDFFQQAIQQATTATQSQIQQLRDMGIMDEALARRALQATGGDIHAALDLIFGDGHF